MKDDFITNNKTLLYTGFFIIALITFFPLFFTGFATADDFHYYLVARRGQVMADSSFFAQFSGRFYLYLVKPFSSLPYIWDNMVVVKLFQYIPLFLCFLVFARILFTLTRSREMALFYLLTFLMIMQISRHTSLFVAYPFTFTFSFLLLLFSFELLLRYYENRKKKMIAWSAVLFAIALLFYEAYIFYLVFAGLIILARNAETEDKWSRRLGKMVMQYLPYLAVGILYLAAYFIYRIYYPTQYTGTNFDSKTVTLTSFFHVIWKLSLSSFPLAVYETSHNVFWDKSELVTGYSPVVLNLILSAKVEWLVKGILVSLLGWLILWKTPQIKGKTLARGLLVALLLIFLPHIPLAMTEKYTFYVEKGDMIGYVTTFFSFFGTVLLITLVMTYFINLFNFSPVLKKAVLGISVFGFFLCSVLTDFSNYSIAKDIRRANIRLYAVDELLKTDEFRSIPPNSPFYAKDLYDNPSYSAPTLTEQGFNWFEYFEAKTGIMYALGREPKIFLDYSKQLPMTPWYIAMRQTLKSEDIVLTMAQMQPLKPTDSVVDHYADRALILYYSPYKYFTVSFRLKGEPSGIPIPIKVNHIPDEIAPDKTIEFSIYDTKKGNAATWFIVQIPGIDLNSVVISNMVNRGNKIFYL